MEALGELKTNLKEVEARNKELLVGAIAEVRQVFERELSGVKKNMGDSLAGEVRDLRDKQASISTELKRRLGDSVEITM